jgi:hypothetical protein
MSCSFIVVPLIVAAGPVAWPLISAAIVGASAALGYQAVRVVEGHESGEFIDDGDFTLGVDLVMDDSKVVCDALMRGESFLLRKEDITARFRINGRGCCTVHVEGPNTSIAELENAGRELMGRVRQQFAYAKVMADLEQRGFQITKQEVSEDRTIRVRVRRQ